MFFVQLNKIAKERGTTPTTVTKELGYSVGSLSHWKKGACPSGDIVVRFAQYFNVTTDYLLTGKENNSRPIIKLVKNPKEDTNMTRNTKEGLFMNEKAIEALDNLNGMFVWILENLNERDYPSKREKAEAILARPDIDKNTLLAWSKYRYLETPPTVYILDELANDLEPTLRSSINKYRKNIAHFEYHLLKEEAESQELKQRDIKIASLEKENERLKQENAQLQHELQKTKPSVYETSEELSITEKNIDEIILKGSGATKPKGEEA